MASPDRQPKEVDALIARYLDPRTSWTSKDDQRLRAAVRASDEAAARYDRAVTLHRAMVGSDPLLPSGLEQQRMMPAVLDGAVGVEETVEASVFEGWFDRLLGLFRPPVVVAGLCALLLLVLLRPPEVIDPPANDEDYMGARGAQFDLTVGIGVSGVTEDGREYEAVEAGGLYAGDYLKIYTTRVVDDFSYVFVFGLQEGRPIWYLPDPEYGTDESVRVPFGKSLVLGDVDGGFEITLSGGRHQLGDLQVVAIYSDRPLTLSEVSEAVETRYGLAAFENWLLVRLGLSNGGITRILRTQILPGSKETSDAD